MTREKLVRFMIESGKKTALVNKDNEAYMAWCFLELREAANGYRDESYTSKEEREALMVSDPLADERLERTIWEAPKKRQEI